MKRRAKKTHAHTRLVEGCTEARKSLLQVVALVEAFVSDEGELLSEDDLRDKAVRAKTWLGEAEAQIYTVAQNLEREIEWRENESDPETIRHRKFQDELREISKRPKRRRSVEELAPDVLRLRDEGLIVPAIADVLKTSDSTVKKILKQEVAA